MVSGVGRVGRRRRRCRARRYFVLAFSRARSGTCDSHRDWYCTAPAIAAYKGAQQVRRLCLFLPPLWRRLVLNALSPVLLLIVPTPATLTRLRGAELIFAF